MNVLLLATVAFAASRSGPAVLPFDGGKTAPKATQAFVQALQEAQLGFKTPKQIEIEVGVPLKPAVHACKGELLCLTQIGSMVSAQQLIAVEIKGKTAVVQVISVADAAVVRKVEIVIGDDPRGMLRAFKDRVFEVMGVTKTGDIVLSNVPPDAVVTIDGAAQEAKAKIAVKPGFRLVKVVSAGGEPFQKEVYVRPGDSVKVKVNLLPAIAAAPPLVAPDAGKEKKEPEAPELVAVAPAKPEPPVEELPLVEPPKAKSDKADKDKNEKDKADKNDKDKADKNDRDKNDRPDRHKGKKMEQVTVAKQTAASEAVVEEIVAAPPVEAIVKREGPPAKVTSPFRVPWILCAALTVGTLASAGVVSVLQANNGAAAAAEPVQLKAVQYLNAANMQTDAANALWITGAALGAITITFLILDLTSKPKQSTLGVAISPNRLALTGTF